MALFEGYERRIDKINGVLNGYGISSIEEAKALPWAAVYDEFCLRNGVPVGEAFLAEIDQYEKEVTSKR